MSRGPRSWTLAARSLASLTRARAPAPLPPPPSRIRNGAPDAEECRRCLEAASAHNFTSHAVLTISSAPVLGEVRRRRRAWRREQARPAPGLWGPGAAVSPPLPRPWPRLYLPRPFPLARPAADRDGPHRHGARAAPRRDGPRRAPVPLGLRPGPGGAEPRPGAGGAGRGGQGGAGPAAAETGARRARGRAAAALT
jgi:hypothetical protein